MKVVILAGGLGTRISEESHLKPKPMIEIGGKPILWHIMKFYSHFGLNDFIICCGYKSHVIKEYFFNYHLRNSNVTFDLGKNKTEILESTSEPWKVTLIETGEDTLTGGRIKRIGRYLDNEDFCMTYGDGLGDIHIPSLLSHHKKSGVLATVSATLPPARFGSLQIQNNIVENFLEKPQGEGGHINGGFFVLSPRVLDYIDGDQTSWEREPLERLAKERQLGAFTHNGFWQPMDTLRDKNHLEDLWKSGKAPWKVWR